MCGKLKNKGDVNHNSSELTVYIPHPQISQIIRQKTGNYDTWQRSEWMDNDIIKHPQHVLGFPVEECAPTMINGQGQIQN